MDAAEQWEPDDARASRPVRRARGGATPPRDSPQRLCAQPEGGRAGDGEHRNVPDQTPQAEGQQSQERGRQTERPQVPGLQLHCRTGATTAHCAAGTCPLQSQGPGADAAHARGKPTADRQGAVSLPHRLARLLRLLPNPSVLRALDEWTRRRQRTIAWKQWKRGRTRFAELRRRGVGRNLAAQTAGSPHGPWRLANSPALKLAMPNAAFGPLGLASVAAPRAA